MYYLLNEKHSISVPYFLMPQTIHNTNNYIISLSDLTKWLSERAQEIGVDIFTGFAGDEVKRMIFNLIY
jgi:electron-transferring-flavoprotein dehydrogenase